MTVGKQDNPSDEVQEESASEPLDPTVDVAKAAPAAAETPDGEAEEAGPEDTEAGESAEPQDTPDDLEVLRAENAQLRDEFLRARADAENARKRAQTEIANARRFALEGFASELLNVRDSLDLARSVDLEETEGVVERVVEGLELTLKQLDAAFDRFSVFEVSPEVGDRLDPELHQAMTLAPSTEVKPNHICQVIQKGYRLHDRLLRPARVIVAKEPDGDEKSEPDA